MRSPSAALLASSFLAASASARFLMYADEWHPTRPTNATDRAGIDHVVLAFAMANATASFQPKVPITTIRSEYPNAKVMIAVGGWGDDIGFFQASQSTESIQRFASDIATMLTNTGADGLDIDWEYPGGNGADYKQVPNADKKYQIDAYPETLAAIRAAIGDDKLLSIAVPGKKGDMIAFTKENGPKIWPSVDFINVMSYDLMNRRDNITNHHTSVAGSEDTIKNYIDIGAPPEKINLGFAYYAKYFTTQGDCGSRPLGCPIELAEDPVTGQDLLTSGAWTFEKWHMTPVDGTTLPISYDGTCGADKGTRCSSGCCSQYGNCGSSVQHCSGGCQHSFGVGCTDHDVAGSWQLAAKNGVTDEAAGGHYYFDAQNQLFWTWDTPELITRKFDEIVRKYQLGGVMAWSLGEDSFDWSHIRQMASELEKGNSGGDTPRAGSSRPFASASDPVAETDATEEFSEEHAPVSSSRYRPRPQRPTTESVPTFEDGHAEPSRSPYNVVWVDGTEEGPSGEPSTEPGSPPDYYVHVHDDGKGRTASAPYAPYSGKPSTAPYDDRYDAPVKPYVAPVDPYGPAPESVSSYRHPPGRPSGPYVPVNEPYVTPNEPYVAPTDPYAAPHSPYDSPADSHASEDTSPAPVKPEVTPRPTHAPVESGPAPIDSPSVGPEPRPYEPDFVPDPGYINPNWKPSPAAPAPVPEQTPAVRVEEVSEAPVPAPAPAPAPASAPAPAVEEDSDATWAQPVPQLREVDAQMEDAGAAKCRARRHRKARKV